MKIRSGPVLFLSVALLLVAATARDALDDWVAHTDLPPLAIDTSTEVLAGDDSLLRAFRVADGRWRLQAGAVDPLFVRMLIA